MAVADFKINGTLQATLGFDATNGQVLSLELESSPGIDAARVQYTQGQKSKDAPDLVFNPADGRPATPTGIVTVTMPVAGVHTYDVLCTVNEGVDAQGKLNAGYVRHRIVAIRTAPGTGALRKVIPAESTQYSARGWSDEQNIEVDAVAQAIAVVGTNHWSAAVADVPNLKGIGPSLRVDRQVRYVETELEPWAFDSGYGANLPDDENTARPNDLNLADPGRWRRLTGPLIQANGTTDQLAELQAAIDAASAAWAADPAKRKRLVRISAGVLLLSAALQWKSGVVTEGAGKHRTTLMETWSPLVGLADDRTNNLTFGVGVLLPAKLNTTLTNAITPGGAQYYGAGTRKLSVNALDNLVAGDYFVVGGHETAVGENPGGSNGAAIDSAEILRCASTQGGTPRISLEWPTKQHHVTTSPSGTPLYVKGLDPLRDVEFRGLSFDCSGGTIAVGMRLDRALRVIYEDVSFKGFSRAAIEWGLGTKDIWFDGIRIDGECNAGLFMSSCMDVLGHDYSTNPDGARHHANGLKRASIFAEQNPIDVNISTVSIRHVVQGISFRGGRHLSVTNFVIDDCDIRPQVVDGYHINLRGVAICTGGGEGDWDEYGGPYTFANGVISNCRSDSGANPDINDVLEGVCCWHDGHNIIASNVLIANNGLADQTTIDGDPDFRMFGHIWQDCSGTFSDLECKGVEFDYVVRSSAGIAVKRIRSIKAPGAGVGGTVSLLIYSGNGVEITDFDIQGYIWFGSLFGSSFPYLLQLGGTCRINEKTVTGPFHVYKNTSGGAVSQGNLLAVGASTWNPDTLTGERNLVTPASNSVKFVEVVGRFGLSGYPNNDYCIARDANTSGGLVLVNGAITAGSYINAVPGQKYGVASSIPTIYTIGISLDTKDSGLTLVQYAPITRGGDQAAGNDSLAARGPAGELVATSFRGTGTIALTGLVRNAKGFVHMAARNVANDGDVALVATESGNNHALFGKNADTTYSAQYASIGGSAYVVVDGGGNVYLQISGAIKATLSASDLDLAAGVALKTDTVSEHTAASGVAVDGLLIKDGRLDAPKWREHVISIDVDDGGAAGAAISEKIAGIPHQACTIVSTRFEAIDNIAGNDTNNATLKVWRRNGSGTQAAVASLQTTATPDNSFTAFVSKSLGSLSNTAVAADESVTVEVTKTAAGARVRGTFTIIVTTDGP